MPEIRYGGLKYIQVRHAVYCKKCSTTIESIHLRDFKFCPCGSIGIDGGIEDGNRILGSLKHMESRSMYIASIGNRTFWLPQEVIESEFNSLY